MNKFDSKLPKTTSYWKEDGIFFIKHTSFNVADDEVRAISALVVHAMNDKDTYAVVINNREAKGAWSQSAINLMSSDKEYISTTGKKKSVTLTNSAITTMQMNRSLKANNMLESAKAFNCEFNDVVKEFLKA